MFYSPILFCKVADVNLIPYNKYNYNMEVINKKNRIIVFSLHHMIYLNKLDYFLTKINKPWILISAMDDYEFPLEIDKIFINKVINNKYFKHWFTINKTTANNKYFTSIPYGLDYWTLCARSYFGEHRQNFETQNYILKNIVSQSVHFSKRIPKIYCNAHLFNSDSKNGNIRWELKNILPEKIVYYQNNRLNRSKTWENSSKYTFVISPFGKGYDCIRTFESLCLGCIVIMKKSFLDIIYEDLPILLVDDYSDINEELLNKTIIEFKDRKYNYNKLTFKYWLELVKSKF